MGLLRPSVRHIEPLLPSGATVDVGQVGTSFTLATRAAIAGGTTGGLVQQATIVAAGSFALLEVAGPSAGTSLALVESTAVAGGTALLLLESGGPSAGTALALLESATLARGTSLALLEQETEKADVAFTIGGESVEQGSLDLNLTGAIVIAAQTAIALTETASTELDAAGETAVAFDVQGDASISDSGLAVIVMLPEESELTSGETSFTLVPTLESYTIVEQEETVSSGGLPSRRPRPRRERSPLTPALYVFGVPTTTIRLVPTLEDASLEWDEAVLESEDDMLVLALADL